MTATASPSTPAPFAKILRESRRPSATEVPTLAIWPAPQRTTAPKLPPVCRERHHNRADLSEKEGPLCPPAFLRFDNPPSEKFPRASKKPGQECRTREKGAGSIEPPAEIRFLPPAKAKWRLPATPRRIGSNKSPYGERRRAIPGPLPVRMSY